MHLYENVSIQNEISLKYIPGVLIDKLALVQAMDWYQSGDKPLSTLMMAQFPETNLLKNTFKHWM